MKCKRILAASMVLLLSGCGISQADYDKVVAERNALQEQVNEQSQSLTEIENRLSLLENNVSNMSIKQTDEPEEADAGNEEPIEESPAEVSDSDITIVKEYGDSNGNYAHHVIVIQNTSSEVVRVVSSSLAYDADNNLIGAGDASVEAVGPSCVTYLLELIDTDKTADHFETTLKAEKSNYNSVLQNLSLELTAIDKGVVATIANNGNEKAESVKACCIFLDNGKAVFSEENYIVDTDIPAGSSASCQFNCDEAYDGSAEVYLSAVGQYNW